LHHKDKGFREVCHRAAQGRKGKSSHPEATTRHYSVMKLTFLTGVAVASLTVGPMEAADAPPRLALPTASQAEWLDAGIGIFVHWAPNVYQGTEGDNLSTPREQINPDHFDAGRIVQAAKSANAGYLIFVAKHVGGYCAWQTATTDYSLKTSPWKGGHGDMVGELAQACRQQGLRFGIYLSPRSDIHHVGVGGSAANAEEQNKYNAIYRRQLSEILTNYGPMFEMWFDGGNVVPVNDLVAQLAPEIITFQGRRANSIRWVGTEHGFAPYPCWNTIHWKEGETPAEGAGTPVGNTWCPAECDVSILRPAWFWRAGSDRNILSLEALVEIYYMSVGRGVNLLLNITPDGHGQIPDAQVRRLQEFGDEISARFAKPLCATHGEGDNLRLDLGGEKTIDHILLREDIRSGERVRKFVVEGLRADGTWQPLAAGTQVGNRQLFPIRPTAVTSVRLTVQESVAPAKIRELAVFRVNRPVPKGAFREAPRAQP
jgi:alpha-L-fucosidase